MQLGTYMVQPLLSKQSYILNKIVYDKIASMVVKYRFFGVGCIFFAIIDLQLIFDLFVNGLEHFLNILINSFYSLSKKVN